MFCTNCGTQRKNPQQTFCTNCGASLPEIKNEAQQPETSYEQPNLETENQAQPTEPTSQPSQTEDSLSTNQNQTYTTSQTQASRSNGTPPSSPAKPKKPLTKKQKISALIATAVVAVLAALFFTATYFTSADYVVKQFQNKIEKEDADKLAGMLQYRGADDEISVDAVAGLITYLKDDRSKYNDILSSLDTQVDTLKDQKSDPHDLESLFQFVFGSQIDDTILLEKGEPFLFFDTYKLSIDPIYVTLQTNYPNTTIFLGEEELFQTTDDDNLSLDYGPLLPGKHTFKVHFENEFATFDKEETFVVENSRYINLDIEARDAYVYYPFETEVPFRVFINDTETDIDIIHNDTIGPFPTEGDYFIKIEFDLPWGTVSTKEVNISDNPYIDYTFAFEGEMQNLLVKSITDHLDVYMNALEDNDLTPFDDMDPYTYYLYEDEFYIIHDYYNTSYEKQITGVEIDLDDFYLFEHEDTFVAYVVTRETSEVAEYYEEEDKHTETEVNNFEYMFVYDNGWQVYNKYYYYYDLYNPVQIDYTSSKIVVEKEYVDEDLLYELDVLVFNYIYYLTQAINYGEYDWVAPYIKEGSPLDEAQRSLVSRLYDKGIEEYPIEGYVVDFRKNGSNYEIDTYEVIEIWYPDGDYDVQEYEWTYDVERVNGYLQLTNIR